MKATKATKFLTKEMWAALTTQDKHDVRIFLYTEQKESAVYEDVIHLMRHKHSRFPKLSWFLFGMLANHYAIKKKIGYIGVFIQFTEMITKGLLKKNKYPHITLWEMTQQNI